MGMEDLSRTISGSNKTGAKWTSTAKNQISRELDKYETSKIERHKK